MKPCLRMLRRRALRALRFLRFVEMLRTRYAPCTRRAPFVSLVLAARSRSWSTIVRLQATVALIRAQRWIKQHMRAPSRAISTVQRAATPGQGATAQRLLIHTKEHERRTAAPIALERIERSCTRIIEHSVRRERASSPAVLGPSRTLFPAPLAVPALAERPLRTHSPTMIVARYSPEPPKKERVAAQVSLAAGQALSGPMREAAAARSRETEPSEHVGALTDEVIRRIDRRIAAHRERFGRA